MNILVVEDDLLIGDMIRLHLELSGHAVLGPAARITEALSLLDASRPDCAVLDVHLGPDGFVTPLAEHLEERGVPFMFVTGYRAVFDEPRAPLGAFRDRPILTKPYRMHTLIETIETMRRPGRRSLRPDRRPARL